MPIYQDDMQSYAVGQHSPWGSLVATGGTPVINNTALPDGLIGPYGQTQFLDIFLAQVTYNDGITRTSGSLFADLCWTGSPYGIIFQFMWGSFPALSLRGNNDGTLTITDTFGNPLVGSGVVSTSDFARKINCWYLIQFNATFYSSGGHLAVDYEVFVDGQSWLSGTWISGQGAGVNWTSTNILSGSGLKLTNLTIDNLQSSATFPFAGSPEIRVTNQVIELIEFPAILAAACPIVAAAQVGVPYDQATIVTGGTPPYTYVLLSGGASLAALGLAFNSTTGHIHGTPTATGTPSYSIQITDADLTVVVITCTVPVVNPAPVIVVTCPPKSTAQLFNAYSSSAGASGGVPAYTFSISAGSLPTGLSMNSSGLVTGSPTVLGTFHFTVHVVDSIGGTGDTPCTIVVSNNPPGRFCVAQA